MELKRVAVRVGERRSVAHPRIERLHREPGTCLLELAPGLVHVRYAQGEPAAVQGERKREVAGLVLDPPIARGMWVAREPERLAVERVGPCEIHRKSFYAIGVFFQQDLFSQPWALMHEDLRVRSYRMYCEAMKLAAGTALVGERAKLEKFDKQRKRLQRTYADVRATQDASAHVDLVDEMLRKARQELRSKRN